MSSKAWTSKANIELINAFNTLASSDRRSEILGGVAFAYTQHFKKLQAKEHSIALDPSIHTNLAKEDSIRRVKAYGDIIESSDPLLPVTFPTKEKRIYLGLAKISLATGIIMPESDVLIGVANPVSPASLGNITYEHLTPFSKRMVKSIDEYRLKMSSRGLESVVS